ncbi:hypothetical protein COHA_005539 [Chlorella ohadii]|uniref:Zinc-binding loop region of homing endonuclease domain-containing protein n=1 Tax=Chlorella ohadii TaxID=2649997 RepID=A0AAD5H4M0_9CHLO|nr:hypothetical protein COHA_005539 [Chlorella ohadii]
MFPERLRTWLTAQAGLANTSRRGLGVDGPARCIPNGSVTICVYTEVDNFDRIFINHPSKSDIDSWSEAAADKRTHFTIHQVVLLACDELELYLLYKLSALLNPNRPDLWLQISHLCHDHGCIRRTHFIVETAIENIRRNLCKLAKNLAHQPANLPAAAKPTCQLPAIAHSPLQRAPTFALDQSGTIQALGGGKKLTANQQRVEAYADALEELINLERVPAPDDVFAPLKTREHVLAFLRCWAEDSDQPSIPGMQFSNKHKSQFALAVMDKATPGHGMVPQARNGTWGRRLVLLKEAAVFVLRKVEEQL